LSPFSKYHQLASKGKKRRGKVSGEKKGKPLLPSGRIWQCLEERGEDARGKGEKKLESIGFLALFFPGILILLFREGEGGGEETGRKRKKKGNLLRYLSQSVIPIPMLRGRRRGKFRGGGKGRETLELLNLSYLIVLGLEEKGKEAAEKKEKDVNSSRRLRAIVRPFHQKGVKKREAGGPSSFPLWRRREGREKGGGKKP